MTFLFEPNRDAYSVSPDVAASGPLVGFLDSFNTAVEAQMRASSQFGIEYFMQELDWQQTQSMLEAGVAAPPQLMLSLEGRDPGEDGLFDRSVAQTLRGGGSGYYEDFIPERSGEYRDVARRYSGEEVSPEFEERLQAYDAHILSIRESHPDLGLRTSREMFDQVRESAQAAEARQQADRRTWGGTLGDFLGGTAASMHPGTDPLNFFSAGAGGAGRTALTRIMSQVGMQGVVETANQITGVQEQRQMLGLSHGFTDAAGRVAATALGAGAVQGAGEIVGAGLRRWFRDTPTDPAPPPDIAEPPVPPQRDPPPPGQLREEAAALRVEANPRTYIDTLADQAPLSGIRGGQQRSLSDLHNIGSQLERWDGGLPSAIRPRTADAAYPGARGPSQLDTTAATSRAQRYEAAKVEDPEAFLRYEKLTEQRNTYRQYIEALGEQRNADVDVTMRRMQERLHALQARLGTVQGKGNKARIRSEIREVKADQEALLRASAQRETPEIAKVREQLMRADEKMRDLAPLIGRAYSRSEGKWGSTAEDVDAVWDAYRQGRTDVDRADSTVPDPDTLMTLYDRAPILQQKTDSAPGATSADTATTLARETRDVIDATLKGYRDTAAKALQEGEGGTLTIDGTDYKFDLDRDTVFIPNEEGTGGRQVTVREHLEELRRVDEELEAVSTCSLR